MAEGGNYTQNIISFICLSKGSRYTRVTVVLVPQIPGIVICISIGMGMNHQPGIRIGVSINIGISISIGMGWYGYESPSRYQNQYTICEIFISVSV